MRLPDAVTYEDENSDEEALKKLLFTNLDGALAELKERAKRKASS